MKYYNKFLLAIVASIILVSCADEFKTDFKTDKPEDIALYEYLNAYDALKTYVDRGANPNFKMGTGITVSDFLAKGLVYSLACSNFDELTAGNAMKYGSCVSDNGSMDFSQVTKFVDAAQNTGLTVYGHTLCWHAQQNNKYLNGLIADKKIPGSSTPTLDQSVITNSTFESGIDGWGGWGNNSTNGRTKDGDGYSFWFTNPSVVNSWEAQIAYDFAAPLEVGATYVLDFKVKGSKGGSISASLQNPDGYKGCGDFPAFDITTEWEEKSLEVVVTGENAARFLFNYGTYAGTINIDDITLCRLNPDGGNTVITKKYVVQSDFEDGAALMGWGNNSTRTVVAGEGYNGTKGHKIVNPSAVNSWEAQAGYDFSGALIEGETYYLNLKIKGSNNGSISAAFQKPDGYLGRGDFPAINITTDWQEITLQTKVTGDGATRFLFSFGAYAGTIWMDDLSLYREESGNSIPLTPEEKKEVLTNAMETWIKGMMEACNGYVKSWDVVNEPMSDGNTNELKSAATASAEDAKNNFYWQDYLGKEYARTVIKFARQYGGDDLKLFINDYNLEATYNNNAKCKGIIKMVEYWESDGVTKIDGIGTQMHVSYNMDSDKQKKQEECIVKMYQLLAASGKLVKISELDMGILDAEGKAIKTVDLTYEQQLRMSEFYKFIVKKYFEIIPVNQQYGITHWSPTDSPDAENSYWRKGEPIGLWSLNYNRKPVYAGFADGLSGK
ncbi:endo-1,4-beta-xylanase [Dysgonomonas sp. Marseille-P4677]|uniref:endo-1,4-beta-xylanase n=1 Tax=Dysgonomonas sp. Marseille-P4677 TaxID=2364790 RepID=UPI0019119146|nr:endo-1,4-beta-xylanase [Dysgonomonas sp. Marseille-P4677]MBK5721688.1 endo-1,4-beta-xylanase [Dysgonomonas sp. Marseille-P4677]